MKTINIFLKFLSIITGLAAYVDMIPAKYAPLAVLVFALSSTLKDLVVKIGDYLDDGQVNGSFKDKVPLLLLCGALALGVCGCVATNPAHLADPAAPAYVVDPRLTNNMATAAGVAGVAAPILAAVAPAAAPVAPLAVPLVNSIGGLLVMISLAFAGWKNRQAAKEKAAANALAATLTPQQHTAALAVAAGNGSTAATAAALANSQSLT